MNKYYYYKRDENNRPLVTICVVKDPMTGEVARGLAFCSPSDQPVKAKGRQIALGRATQAMKHQKDMNYIRHQGAWHTQWLAHKSGQDTLDWCLYKSYYNPKLTDLEQRIMAPRPTPEAA
jgi:hypothetical protein